jgi:hypothetical protein
MPLDWDEVMRRYGPGAQVPTVAGGKTLDVTGADEHGISIRGGSLWTAELRRADLERAVELLEAGVLERTPVAFVEGYHEHVAPERGTAVAHILKDLGLLG